MTVSEIRETGTIALMGHSYLAYGSTGMASFGNPSTPGSATCAVFSRSFFTWAMIELGQPLKVIGDTSVSGATSTTIRTGQLAAILALKPQYVLLHCTTNDIFNGISAGDKDTLGTTIGNVHAIVRALNGAGITVILGTDLPRSGMSSPNVNELAKTWNYFKENVQDYRSLFIFDPFLIFLNNSTLVNGYNGVPLSSRFLNESDNFIHPNAVGARLSGKLLAEVFRKAGVKQGTLNTTFNGDANTLGDQSLVTLNPLMSTDTGFFSGAGFTGAVSNSYFCGRVVGSSLVVNGSVITRDVAGQVIPFFSDELQCGVTRLVLTGAAATTETVSLAAGAGPNNLAPGSGPYVLECEFGVDVKAGTLERLTLACEHATNFNRPGSYNVNSSSSDTLQMPVGKYSGILKSRRFWLPTLTSSGGAYAAGRHSAVLLMSTGINAQVDVYVSRLCMRKV